MTMPINYATIFSQLQRYGFEAVYIAIYGHNVFITITYHNFDLPFLSIMLFSRGSSPYFAIFSTLFHSDLFLGIIYLCDRKLLNLLLKKSHLDPQNEL